MDATASDSQIRGVLVFAVSGQRCADLGQRVSNLVHAARENSQAPQTIARKGVRISANEYHTRCKRLEKMAGHDRR